MTLETPIAELSASVPVFPVRRFSVDEYHRMIDAGVLTEDDRVELLEGWIVPQMVRRPRHDATIELVEAAIKGKLPSGYRLRSQSAITLADSEPEPDLAIVQGTARDHMDRHPTPAEVALVIEIAETSLARDRQKCHVYARAGIPHYWIVNLADRQVEVYSQPGEVKNDDEINVWQYAVRNDFAGDDCFEETIAESTLKLTANALLP